MSQPHAKRQRVNLACDTCRRRKVKCDGRQPVCEPCRKSSAGKIRCTWASGDDGMLQKPATSAIGVDGRTQSSGTVQGLPLKEQRQVTGDRLSMSQSIQRDLDFFPMSAPKATETMMDSTIPSSGLHQSQIGVQDSIVVSQSEGPVHGIIGAAMDGRNRHGFFGNSSAGAFMQNVKKVLQQSMFGASEYPKPTNEDRGSALLVPGSSKITSKPVDYVLPSRRRADALMSCYWTYVHTLYPLLDKPQTQEEYENLWKPDSPTTEEKSFICLLNVIFALSSQIDDPMPESRQSSAQEFCKRTRDILDIAETGSIRSVQTLLLLGQYYQSTSEPHPCWMFTGCAIRTAQGLGLHLAETSANVSNIRHRELLRRVWHGCILMDRAVSMTYGRPVMIGPEAAQVVPLPSPRDAAYIEADVQCGESIQNQHNYTGEFLVLTLQLYEIMRDVIFNVYALHVRSVCRQADSVNTLYQEQNEISEIGRKLSQWEISIPKRLQVSTYSNGFGTTEAASYRQAVVLRQRRLHIQLLWMRPALLTLIAEEIAGKEAPTSFEGLLSRRMNVQCAVVCVKVAMDAIDTIVQARSHDGAEINFCAAWWYNVLYLYTASTVLIAARLAPAILSEISERLVDDQWHVALEILQGYSDMGPSIERLTTTLRHLSNAVLQQQVQLRDRSSKVLENESNLSQTQYVNTDTLPDEISLDPANSDFTFQNDAEGKHLGEYDALPDTSFIDINAVFDPNDLSWLTSIPLST